MLTSLRGCEQVVLLKSCRDGNIVQFLGASQTEHQTLMITECVSLGCCAATTWTSCVTSAAVSAVWLGSWGLLFEITRRTGLSCLNAAIHCASICVFRYMENGDLFTAFRNDTSGSLLWYRRCAAHVAETTGFSAAHMLPAIQDRTSACLMPLGTLWQLADCAGCPAFRDSSARDGMAQPGLGRQIALDIARGLHFLHRHSVVSVGLGCPMELIPCACFRASPLPVHIAILLRCFIVARCAMTSIMISALAWQVHFDLKSPNVLLGRDNVAKIADVGLAKILQKDYVSSLQSCGTFAWSVRPNFGTKQVTQA